MVKLATPPKKNTVRVKYDFLDEGAQRKQQLLYLLTYIEAGLRIRIRSVPGIFVGQIRIRFILYGWTRIRVFS